jgi:ribosomal protein S27AE
MERELQPLEERLDETRHAIEESGSTLEPDLPDPPEPVVVDPDDEDWLFDRRRDYMEQLRRYKKGKEWARMQAAMRDRRKVCPECGTSFVAKHKERAVYCTPKCRLRAHRKQSRASYLKRKTQRVSE